MTPLRGPLLYLYPTWEQSIEAPWFPNLFRKKSIDCWADRASRILGKMELVYEMAQTKSGREALGIQSVEVGGRLIQALADERIPLTLTAIAKRAGMPTSKARRYLVSYIAIGLVQQDPISTRYSPGPLALAIGLAALGQIDVVQQSERVLRELRDELNETIVLAVWTDGRPIIIRREDSYRPITLNIRMGSSLPIDSSATGQVFKAYGSPTEEADSPAKTKEAATVRAQGYAEVDADLMSGLYGLSVPVFDGNKAIVAAITLVAQLSGISDARRRRLRAALLKAARNVSTSLGNI
jgi:DNA-binding IclR family transcriptional regulator